MNTNNQVNISNYDSLFKIDQIIINFKTTSFEEIRINDLIEVISIEILKHLKLIIETNYAVDSLFNKEISFEKQKFIAICFLRLINANSCFLDRINGATKNKLFELFDNTFIEVYKFRNIQVKDQRFKKENILKDFINDLEKKFSSNQLLIEDINAIENFEMKYLKTINANFVKLFILDFIPNQLTKTERLVEIFKTIKEYNNCELNSKIENYQKAIEIIEKIIADSKSYLSYYCKEIILKPFQKILNLLKRDFSNSPFCKPANLEIKTIGKKYPFLIENKVFKINFLISKEGAGLAYNTVVKIKEYTGNFKFSKKILELGLLSSEMLVEFDCIFSNVEKNELPANDMIIILEISWNNYDLSVVSKEFEFELFGQRTDLDWDYIKRQSPFNTEYVDTEEEFIGRKEILNILISHADTDKLISSVIFGQRRVGKTSIVKTLKNILEKKYLKDYVIFYNENGDFNCTTPVETILKLGENICQTIKYSDSKYESIDIPEFGNSFSSINNYLNKILRIVPNFKLIIILDEFDKIPTELYKRCEIGDAFFSTLRAISNKPNFSFILVGGERMEYIMRDQSQEINKFKSFRVDYFSKENYWRDFQDLVTKPMIKYNLEILDEGVEYIYSQTAGNPFFTKVICDELFRLMINNRDSCATKLEAIIARNNALQNAGEQLFSHFWQDGIRDITKNETDLVANRKKILILIANLIKEFIEPKYNIIIH
jgi:hypothetical protein